MLSQQHISRDSSKDLPRIKAQDASYQALRSCCKWLRMVSDKIRPSISFPVEEQEDVELYLRRLPLLDTISVSYGMAGPEICGSLQSLFCIQPNLVSITVRCPPAPLYHQRSAIFSSLPWCNTLSHLVLHNIHCFSDHIIFDQYLTTFLDGLPSLTSLNLQNVTPTVSSEDIAGMTCLKKLVLCGNRCNRSWSLDFSPCILLEDLRVTNFCIKKLNLTGLIALQHLDCSSNGLSELDVSTCTALLHLTCCSNSFSLLDVMDHPSLAVLRCCSSKYMWQLRVSGCSHMLDLLCTNCRFPHLDLSGCSSLRKLVMTGNCFSALDLRPCISLEYFGAGGCCHLETINLGGSTTLMHVSLDHCKLLATLDARGCTALETLCCDASYKLHNLHLAGCARLHTLLLRWCRSLDKIDISSCTHLRRLDSKDCRLICPHLSLCEELEEVNVSGSRMTALDLSRSAANLARLVCDSCPSLAVLSLAGCSKLISLSCKGVPKLQQLNLNGCDSLVELSCLGSGLFAKMTLASLHPLNSGEDTEQAL